MVQEPPSTGASTFVTHTIKSIACISPSFSLFYLIEIIEKCIKLCLRVSNIFFSYQWV